MAYAKKPEMNENSHGFQKYTLTALVLSPRLIAFVRAASIFSSDIRVE